MSVSEATKAFMSKYWGPAAEYVDPQQVETALTAALPFLQGVKVKALEWTRYEDSDASEAWEANTPFSGCYVIKRGLSGYTLTTPDADEEYDTLEAAKASAQADYEARIRSAIEVAPSPRAQALEEAGFRKEYAALGRTLNSLALNANDEDMKPAVAELSRRIFRTILGVNPSPLGSVEDITSSADNRYGLEVAAKWHETEAEYYEARHGDKDGVPFPIVAGWHRLHAQRLRALSSQPVADGHKTERELVLEKALKPFSDIAGELFAMNYNESDVVFTVHRKTPKGSKITTAMTFKAFNNARAALPASPGASE